MKFKTKPGEQPSRLQVINKKKKVTVQQKKFELENGYKPVGRIVTSADQIALNKRAASPPGSPSPASRMSTVTPSAGTNRDSPGTPVAELEDEARRMILGQAMRTPTKGEMDSLIRASRYVTNMEHIKEAKKTGDPTLLGKARWTALQGTMGQNQEMSPMASVVASAMLSPAARSPQQQHPISVPASPALSQSQVASPLPGAVSPDGGSQDSRPGTPTHMPRKPPPGAPQEEVDEYRRQLARLAADKGLNLPKEAVVAKDQQAKKKKKGGAFRSLVSFLRRDNAKTKREINRVRKVKGVEDYLPPGHTLPTDSSTDAVSPGPRPSAIQRAADDGAEFGDAGERAALSDDERAMLDAMPKTPGGMIMDKSPLLGGDTVIGDYYGDTGEIATGRGVQLPSPGGGDGAQGHHRASSAAPDVKLPQRILDRLKTADDDDSEAGDVPIEQKPDEEESELTKMERKLAAAMGVPYEGKQEHEDFYEGTHDWEYPDGSRYKGQFFKNQPHGDGVMIYASGNKYVGQFKAGAKDGQGMYIYHWTGESYSGEWRDGKKCGHGTYIGYRGDKYEGEWFDDKPNGQGKRIDNAGQYVGEFLNWKPHGFGIRQYPNGTQYIGQYKDGMRHGQGTVALPDGTKYNAFWENDKEIQDNSTYEYDNGDRYDGQWKNRMPHGEGTMIYGTGSRYIGQFLYGKPEGYGTYEGVDGEKYYGEWKLGRQHGVGTSAVPGQFRYHGQWRKGHHWGNGRCKYDDSNCVYDGQWVKGVPHGNGVYHFADGGVYTGEWSDGLEHGAGQLAYPNGNLFIGHWNQGYRIGPGHYEVSSSYYNTMRKSLQPLCLVHDKPVEYNQQPVRQMFDDLHSSALRRAPAATRGYMARQPGEPETHTPAIVEPDPSEIVKTSIFNVKTVPSPPDTPDAARKMFPLPRSRMTRSVGHSPEVADDWNSFGAGDSGSLAASKLPPGRGGGGRSTSPGSPTGPGTPRRGRKPGGRSGGRRRPPGGGGGVSPQHFVRQSPSPAPQRMVSASPGSSAGSPLPPKESWFSGQ
eukprot:GFYU01007136.1.p1 GENE.GFYU01007136.1~~GFYU01007136.1.p1  ORF type:complete len:1033 (-),score=235.62 GFYU01007136.1:335-3433(-)